MLSAVRITSFRVAKDIHGDPTAFYLLSLTDLNGEVRVVEKRYSDFIQLHRLLRRKLGHFQHVDRLPPLPPKNKTKYFIPIWSWVEQLGNSRQPSLEAYVQALIDLDPACADIAVAQFFEVPGHRDLGLPPGTGFFTRYVTSPLERALELVCVPIMVRMIERDPEFQAAVRNIHEQFWEALREAMAARLARLEATREAAPGLRRSQSWPVHSHTNAVLRFEQFPAGHDEVDANSTCGICLEEIVAGDWLGRLPCDHVYHEHCVTQWFQQQPGCQCPTCRCDCRSGFNLVDRSASGRLLEIESTGPRSMSWGAHSLWND